MSDPTHIDVVGAREHNLKGVDLRVPRDAMVVFTGVSGSGKSSLAFDTIYKEGQRRYMESMSAYARQFLGQMTRPDVESVEGLSPTLCIDQKTVNRNPRSTVGTLTEIYDHLRLLMARLGTPRCPRCGSAIARASVAQVVDAVLDGALDERISVLGPMVQARKGEYRKELDELRRDGWVRVRVDGVMRTLDEDIVLQRYEKHTIEVVVDRLRVRHSDRSRLAEAIESAHRIGEGVVHVLVNRQNREEPEELAFSTERACPRHPEISIPELEPRLFSFNAPQGACTACEGLGKLARFDVDRMFDDALPPTEGFAVFNHEGRVPFAKFDRKALASVVRKLGMKVKTPLSEWPEQARQRLLRGDPGIRYTVVIDRDGRIDRRERDWTGLLSMVERVYHYTRHKPLERFRVVQSCEACKGLRLNPVALAVRFRDRSIADLAVMSVRDADAFFAGLRLDPTERTIGELLVREIRDRLSFLVEVGLGYLALDRSARTLSGGEGQRIRLASQVGSSLRGVTYVLDEPSIGLHPRDNARLLGALRRLRDRGNSVLVVEHDAETIEAADFVVDIGPGAGREGGHVVAATTPGRFRAGKTLTAAYLRGERSIPVPEVRREPTGTLGIRGAAIHNLQDVDVDLPLGVLVVVTGVSGSGKSSLVFDVLERNLTATLRGEPLDHVRALEGVEQVDKIIKISQTPIGRTPRSNPATYTGAFDVIRGLFAATPEARARGYKKGRFSFNVEGGRCDACHGAGVKVIEMQFLPSVEVPCDVCAGRRFNRETLEITYKGMAIDDVLSLSVSEAYERFRAVPKLERILSTMVSVGLGYVPIGQPSTTLSGGEAQRIKLASELHRPATGRTLYLLDEPTTGLHFEDVAKLLGALQALVDAGNTVVVVEHHTDIIKAADRLIDLGPEGGDGGGQVVGTGTPEQVVALPTPTGRSLAQLTELGVPVAAEPVSRRRRRTRGGSGGVLRLRGARQHNLQHVDVDLPLGTLAVITGVSGSGKTSLAFDTVFAEGQRQYVESLSTYARRFLGRMERPALDKVEGLAPAIAIDQKRTTHNPRSTVATVTEIHDVLRLLYARVGQVHCPSCGRRVRPWSPSHVAQELRVRGPGTGWLVTELRPVGEQAEERRRTLMSEGWTRLLDDRGCEVLLEDPQPAAAVLASGGRLVLDRLNPSRTAATRLAEAVEAGYRRGGGAVTFVPRKDGDPHRFTERPECPEHGVVLAGALTPRHFSFNSRLGACERCDGLGVARALAPDRLLADPELGVWDAIDSRVVSILTRSARKRALVEGLLDHLGLCDATPVLAYTSAQRHALLYGLDTPLRLSWSRRWGRSTQRVEEERRWDGLVAIVSGWSGDHSWLMTEGPCPDCGGSRLKRAIGAVTIEGVGIGDLARAAVTDALEIVGGWSLEGERALIAARPLAELVRRLGFLRDVGLGYLTLDRAAKTLSGGEAQRIRLASQLGVGLTGVIYVLDEPTIGLHPRDIDHLLGTLEGLRDLGNTVLLVEHDAETIRRADHVIDMGPGAGRHGGRVIASGTPSELMSNPSSVTGRWLSGAAGLAPRVARRTARSWITITRPRGNNLRCEEVRVPTGVWVAVTGVSGSGKSTLVMDTLAAALRVHVGQSVVPAPHERIDFGETVDKVVVVDQSPIGRTPRSTPATYVGAMDGIRSTFANTAAAKARGWGPGRFSFNAAAGRCGLCEGRGAALIEMHFLPDVWVTCEACGGRRYDRETLEVRYRGVSIADVMGMRVDDALELFRNRRRVARKLQALVDVGLGYLTLGQPGNTLSGGEAQRVKLAAELHARRGHAVFVLDEPTTGLHMQDVAQLIGVLHRLVEQGHTVVTIEHHLDLVQQADWIVDLGPEGGKAGGLVVAVGPPEMVRETDTATGQALRVASHPR